MSGPAQKVLKIPLKKWIIAELKYSEIVIFLVLKRKELEAYLLK